ncbi:unnamed protein product [Onchocerca flexuosa]|uniref:Ovule protein n=1 Tax=Onchocerca flexuosa TaxID=387005 RepID=A0A183H343_9BILA|nr:unnamed protein product [Onchocerca flexuosa]
MRKSGEEINEYHILNDLDHFPRCNLWDVSPDHLIHNYFSANWIRPCEAWKRGRIQSVKGRVSILFCIFYHPPSKAKSFSTVSSRGPECPSNSRV